MKITNKNNLPEPIVNAITKHTHRGGFISASQVTISPREYWLKKRHAGEIESDVSDMIWALFGTAVHSIIEKGEGKEGLSEAYLEAEVMGEKVTGTADYYENGVISDWKTDSAWTLIYKSREEERKLQLNIYAYLFRKAGFEVNKLQIVSIIRDWSKTKAKTDANYPQSQVITTDYELMTDVQIETVLQFKIVQLKEAQQTPSDELLLCTDEYRWKEPTKFAVMKKGRKSAVKLHTSEESASEHIQNLDGNHYIEIRPSVAKKCKDYCSAYKFCNQAQNESDSN